MERKLMIGGGSILIALIGAAIWGFTDLIRNPPKAPYKSEPIDHHLPPPNMDPAHTTYMDMLAYCSCKSRSVHKRFTDVEVFLDWIKDTREYDYNNNFWIIHVRRDWYRVKPDTKHRPVDPRLVKNN